MKIKTTLAAITLLLAPTFALAEGCIHDRQQEASLTCAVGTTYDADTKSCVTTTS
jgi:hypothetical protein